MTIDPPDDAPRTDRPSADIDPAALKDAHGRSGRMFQAAGLPFEEEEFDEDGGNGDGATGDDGAGETNDDSAPAAG